MSAKPYPGLRPFRRSETDIFFGREDHTDTLVDWLGDTRFLSVVGPSGCGKSSLVKAGLLDALESGFMAKAGAGWRFVEMRPGDRPLLNLAEAVIKAWDLPRYQNDSAFFKASLEYGPGSLIDFIDHHPLPEYCNLLIIVDQFEEIFRLASRANQEEADSFIALLLETVKRKQHAVYVVITMRSDYIGDCARFPGLPEKVNEAQFLTPRMTREQSQSAIEKPARVFGGRIEPALANRLLNDMGTDPDQLPLMQHAMMRMWDHCANGGTAPPETLELASDGMQINSRPVNVSLTVKDYLKIGSLNNALSKHANEAFGELDKSEQQIAQTLFRILTERRPERHDLRRPKPFKNIVDIIAASKPSEKIKPKVVKVIEAFRRPDRCFITPPDKELEDHVVLDISHESLIRKWDQLNDWAIKEAAAADTYRELLPPSGRWKNRKSIFGSGLWGGQDLKRAYKWLGETSSAWAELYGGDYRGVERFIRDSRIASAFRKAAFIALLCVICLVPFYFQKHFADQEKLKLEKEHLEKTIEYTQRSESRMLAERSLDSTSAGSSTIGMILSKNALLIEGDDEFKMRPYVPIAELALYAAVHVPHELAFLVGHDKGIAYGTFSPDGRTVATASWDGTARLWNVDTGHATHVLGGHDGAVVHIAFEPSGQYVATSSLDGTTRLWNSETGELEQALDAHKDPVVHAAFSPDGKLLATASIDKTARIWEVETGTPVHVLSGHSEAVQHVMFNSSGTSVLTASWDKTAAIWDVADGDLMHALDGHTAAVKLAAFSQSGDRVVTASDDGTARIWETGSGELFHILEAHKEEVLHASFSRQGHFIVTASRDGTAIIWNSATGELVKVLKGHSDAVRSAIFSPHGDRIVTASEDGTASLWDSRTGQIIYPLRGHEQRVKHAMFNPQGNRVLTVSFDSTARIWNARRNCFNSHDDKVFHAAISQDGTILATASRDNTARIWHTATGDEVHVLQGHDAPVVHVSFNPKGNLVLTSSRDKSARVWNATTGAPMLRLIGHSQAVRRAVFNSSADLILTASEDHTARIWNAKDGTMVFSLNHTGSVHHAAFSPQGDKVVTASADKTAKIWDEKTGELLHLLERHTDEVLFAVFSPEGDQVATASNDGTVVIWDSTTGKQVFELTGHSGFVTHVAFSPKGDRLVTASLDGTAMIWRLTEETSDTSEQDGDADAKIDFFDSTESIDDTPEHLVLRHDSSVTWAVFNAAGNRIATASEDGKVILWDVEEANKVAIMDRHRRAVRMAAFNTDGTILLSASDDGTVRLWEVFPTTESLVKHADVILKDRQMTWEERRKFTSMTDR